MLRHFADSNRKVRQPKCTQWGSLVEKINEGGGNGCTSGDGKCHPGRHRRRVTPQTLIVILNCVLGKKGCVLVRKSCGFGLGPRIVFRRDLDDVAGHVS